MDSYEKIGINNEDKETKSPLNLLLNTLNHMKNRNQLLIIPLTLYSGFEQAYLGADFTKSFISCIKGIENVGVIMIVYGVSDTLGFKMAFKKIQFRKLNSCYCFIRLIWFWLCD